MEAQPIERYRALTPAGLKQAAEPVEGSFLLHCRAEYIFSH